MSQSWGLGWASQESVYESNVEKVDTADPGESFLCRTCSKCEGYMVNSLSTCFNHRIQAATSNLD